VVQRKGERVGLLEEPCTSPRIRQKIVTFPDPVNRDAFGKEPTVVSRRGKDLAVVIPMEDLHLLERLVREERDRIDLEEARAALKEAEEKGTVPLRDLLKQPGQ
jgi:PHD/YefM family antitoxin component YafN of YafNO toxin-antitoxin module